MLIAQISDLHITEPGRTPGAGVDSSANLARVVVALNALDPQPDLVVASGDLVEEGRPAQYGRLVELLAPVRAPVHVMIGNHDERRALAQAFPALVAEAEAHGLQYVVDDAELRLVMLDSALEGTPVGRLGRERLHWLDAALSRAPQRPTMVFVHHPPISIGMPLLDESRLQDASQFAEVIARHRQVIRVSCGHMHRVVSTTWAGTTVTVCPSTAHQFALDLRPDGDLCAVAEPFGFQLHRWHDGTLQTITLTLR